MPDNDHLVQLDDLDDEGLQGLKVALGTVLDNGGPEVVVIYNWKLHSREEVAQNSVEERDILVKELREIDIVDGPVGYNGKKNTVGLFA